MRTRTTQSLLESLEPRALFTVTPDPGSTLATAFNVGNLNGQVTLGDAVGASDASDVYKFTMARDGQFFGRLRVDSGSADITLIKQTFDSNGHEIDPVIISRTATRDGADVGFASGDLPGQSLTAGNYFLFTTSRAGNSPYLVRMTADYAGDTVATARNIGSLTDASFQDFVGLDTSPSLHDANDLYKFKLDADGQLTATFSLENTNASVFKAHLEAGQDFNHNGLLDGNEILIRTTPGSTGKDVVNLAAGTYFLRMASDMNFSNYHMHLNADYADPTAGRVRATGPLDKGKSFNDFLSASGDLLDPVDLYKFTVSSTRPLNLVFLEDGGGKSFLRVIKDRNNDGIPQPDTETVLSTGTGSFANALTTIDAGNYFIQVVAASGAGTYQLFAIAPPDAAGNTLATAKNIGTVNGLNHQEEFLSDQDPVDFFKFTTSAAGRVSAQLDIELDDDANLALIRDANNNGKVDPSEILAASNLPANQVDALSKSVSAGTYFLRVTYNGFEGNTKYLLSFHTDYAGSTPATARNVGALAGTKNFDDWASQPFGGVISDSADVYKFSLASTKTFSANVIGALSGQDLDLQLYRDKNNDGVLSANELVASSHKFNSPNEQISKSLTKGTYFLKVVGVNGETNYHLTLKA